jgi:hypothetical protein
MWRIKMKARDFLEQEKEVMQIVPMPFSVDAVKSSFLNKEAEFEYTGIEISDVKFSSEGTILTLSQDGKTATATFSYSDDAGPFVSVKPGQSQGESVNLDLTPLSPPIIDTQIGKQVDMNLSWMTVEAFEGIVSAAGMKPVEIDPNAPPDNLGSQGSGASTPTSELPQQKTVELDAKQVSAPTPRSGFPGESFYSDGKSRYYPGIKVSAIDEIGKKNEVDVGQDAMVYCKDCGYEASELEFTKPGRGIELKCPKCGSMDIEDVKENESHHEDAIRQKSLGVEIPRYTRVSDLDIPTQHQIKIAQKTLKMPGSMVGVMGGMTKEEAREILKKYGLLPKGESLKEQEDDKEESLKEQIVKSEKEAIEQAKANAARFGRLYYINSTSDGLRVEREPVDGIGSGFGNKTLYKVTPEGDVKKYKSEESLRSDGTSKYHPGLKQEAIHRVTWAKGKDIFVTDVEAGSEREAGKKVKDSVKADKIISVGKQQKENLREEIQSEFNKHLKDIPESKNLTYFRFAIREGKRIKIPVGKSGKGVVSRHKKGGIKKEVYGYENGEEEICPVCYGRGDKDCPRCKGKGTVVLENKIKKAVEFLKRFGT